MEPEEKEFIRQSADSCAELANVHKCEGARSALTQLKSLFQAVADCVLLLLVVPHAVENGKVFEELLVESRIEMDRHHASDPINTIHQMVELDSQTLLVTKTKK